MFSIVTRLVSVALFATAAVLGCLALMRGDERLLLAQIAQALFGGVLWFTVPPGARSFEAPRFGTRGLRLTLYLTILFASLAASVPGLWEEPHPYAGTHDGLFVLALAVLLPLLNAERRRTSAA